LNNRKAVVITELPIFYGAPNAIVPLGIAAVLAAAAALMIVALAVTPAFTISLGDGNIIIILKNKRKSIASGFGPLALNNQSDTLVIGGR
jgi:hypothetical protein